MTHVQDQQTRAERGGSAASVSVVICAYTEQRWAETLAAVDSVRRQTRPAAEIILVVDHNPALQGRFTAALPDVTVTANREAQGLSGGKNTGVTLARGDIVAFLDDDAVAHPGWLAHLAAAYSDPAVVGVGGLTLPWWETAQPSWFPDEFAWTVGCTYTGMPTSRAPVRNLHGGNASFRRDVFAQVGGFSNGIGRAISKRPLGCEETEFCIRLGQHLPGSVLLFDNGAVIWHHIPAARSRFSYFRSRCYAEGLSKALVTASVGAADALSSERSYTTRTLPRGVARGLGELLRGHPAGAGRAGAIIVGLAETAAGYLIGSLHRLRWRHPRAAASRAGALAGGRMR